MQQSPLTPHSLLIMGYNTGPLHLVLVDEALGNLKLNTCNSTVSLQMYTLHRGFRVII